MSNVSEVYDLWLKAAHLPADKAVNVTIEKAAVRVLHPRPTEEKPAIVLSFVGKSRRLILNSTNANAMATIGGEDTDGWAGLVISLKRQKYNAKLETIIIGPALTTNGNANKPGA